MLDDYVVLKNLSTGKEINISKDNVEGFILESTDFKQVPASFGSYKAVGQIGEYVSSVSLGIRQPDIVGWIVSTNPRMIDFYMQELNRFVNPNDNIKMERFNRYYLTGKPVSSVSYGNTIQENNEYMVKFMITVYCSDPLYYEIFESSRELAFWKSNFHFPLIIKQNEGVQFGRKQDSLVTVVDNYGDFDIGAVIIFSARGTLTNPFLVNLKTQEEIKVKTQMNMGDIIHIDTRFNRKAIYLLSAGETEWVDITNKIDYPNSEYIQLAIGGNMLRHGADLNEENLEVRINYIATRMEVAGE